MAESNTRHASHSPRDPIGNFRKCWIASTADNNLTLHGFRRFKTTHLLNLRFLENEIADMDHIIYQAGLSLGLSASSSDRLGLNHSKRDANVPKISDSITPEFILKLRDLLKQYDEALAAFNGMMAMETFSLLDDEKQSSWRSDLNLYEVYKTRLLRVDLGTRARTDPFQRWLHRYLRAFRYWRLSRKSQNSEEGFGSFSVRHHHRWSYQNTILIADIIGRVTAAAFTAVFLVAPLAILSHESSKNVQLVVISVCILVLSFLVSLFLKVSSFEMMAISAAYAAVLSVFVSNTPARA
ncbi:uncharacterized protein BDZ99DRAFT_454406 [Mytilinidion resinicola]|uniref:DUF6594 domain-containing protein n=1 Tax=Mytilinidion resinicola TaxID=574789 RepID=A0A6A6Y1M7_9PEZI|nr:uncharacterized protein BDZ99DRAFT_454406 [Mytilinidion resinicola]KAF2802721.1 hypothetical protein BDZ99DRAFT_454406 [Mytilinidion resinicola]